MLRCHQHIKNNQICTHNHFIYYEELCTEVKNQIDIKITELINSELYLDLCEKIIADIYNRIAEITKAKLQKELIMLNKQIKDYYKNTPNYYCDSNIPNDLRILFNKQKKLTGQLTDFANKNSISFQTQSYLDYIRNNVKQYLHSFTLTKETLTLFIKKIEVGHLEKTSTGMHQKIRIHFCY